jgi:hypothetical protein
MGFELRLTKLGGLKQAIEYSAEGGARQENQKIDISWLQMSLCYRF